MIKYLSNIMVIRKIFLSETGTEDPETTRKNEK